MNSNARFKTESKNRFLSKADPLIVAFALAGGHTVVTHEKAEPISQKVKIPDVCQALGVECRDTFYVLSQLKARFVLETKP